MYSTPFRRGTLPTSTPIQARSNGQNIQKQSSLLSHKVLHTLSPIKEQRPSKRIYQSFSRNFCFDAILSSEKLDIKHEHELNKDRILKCDISIDTPAKELHFDDLSYSLNDSCVNDTGYSSLDQNVEDNILRDVQAEDWHYFYENILPSYENGSPSKVLFKKNFGNAPLEHSKINCSTNTSESHSKKCSLSKVNVINYSRKRVDFLEELKKINCTLIISTILSYLSEEDLCKASCVNKTWKDVILQDEKSNGRRKAFIKQKRYAVTGPHKENQVSLKSGQEEREHKTAFHDIINKSETFNQPTTVHPKTRFESFIEVGRNLGKDARLMKCPKCQFAAKDQNGNTGVCSNCCYMFCKKCLNPYQSSHNCCSKPNVPIIIIGSKQSRKNLKRL